MSRVDSSRPILELATRLKTSRLVIDSTNRLELSDLDPWHFYTSNSCELKTYKIFYLLLSYSNG